MKTTCLLMVAAWILLGLTASSTIACPPSCTYPWAGFTLNPEVWDGPLGKWVVARDDYVALSAWAYSGDYQTWISYTWSFSPDTPYWDCESPYSWGTSTWSTIGDKQVTLTVWDHDSDICNDHGCCSDHAAYHTENFRVIQVDHLEYLNPATGVYEDVPSTLYVAKDSSITFKAIPTPTVSVWAYHKPEWTWSYGVWSPGVSYGDSEGVHGFTFWQTSSYSTDYKTVTATCGNSETANVIVVGVDSVTHDRAYCWEGGQITFTAIPTPSGASFPSGQPVWTASAGFFPSGNTGPHVTWQAPSGAGGYATITAACGSSSANDTVSYGFVTIGGSGGDLLRSESDVFFATVQPPDFPVSFAQGSSTSPYLSVNPLWGVAIEVDNLILASDAQAYVDTGLAVIEAIVPDLSGKVFGRSYNLKKFVSDWAQSVVLPDAGDLYSAGRSEALSLGGNAAKDALLAEGFNSIIANGAKENARAAISAGFEIINPDTSITESVINESRTYSGTYSLSVTTADLRFTLLPEFEPPGDVMAWIGSINEHGFTGVLTDLVTGPKVTLNVNATGVDWTAGFSGSIDFSDNYGHAVWAFSVNLRIYLH